MSHPSKGRIAASSSRAMPVFLRALTTSMAVTILFGLAFATLLVVSLFYAVPLRIHAEAG